jgi:hypothetical protein
MFLLSPEADMHPGDLQAQVPWRNAFWFADREARQRLTVRLRDLWRTRAIPCGDSGPLIAHGLLRNHKETEVSHSPTVIQPPRIACQLAAHNWNFTNEGKSSLKSTGRLRMDAQALCRTLREL